MLALYGVKILRKKNGLVWCLLPFGDDSLRKIASRGLDLRWADLSNQDMREARLWKLQATGCKMRNTDLLYASLRYAILNRADLRGAKFDYCDLTSAVFCKSDLRGVSFRYSNLYCADFGDAIIDETTCFDNCVNRETASFKPLHKLGSKSREKYIGPETPALNMIYTSEPEHELREQLEILRLELVTNPSEGLLRRVEFVRNKLESKLKGKRCALVTTRG